jgi:hypothetical protein
LERGHGEFGNLNQFVRRLEGIEYSRQTKIEYPVENKDRHAHGKNVMK